MTVPLNLSTNVNNRIICHKKKTDTVARRYMNNIHYRIQLFNVLTSVFSRCAEQSNPPSSSAAFCYIHDTTFTRTHIRNYCREYVNRYIVSRKSWNRSNRLLLVQSSQAPRLIIKARLLFKARLVFEDLRYMFVQVTVHNYTS